MLHEAQLSLELFASGAFVRAGLRIWRGFLEVGVGVSLIQILKVKVELQFRTINSLRLRFDVTVFEFSPGNFESLRPAVVHHELDETLDLAPIVGAVTVLVEKLNGGHDLGVTSIEVLIYLWHDFFDKCEHLVDLEVFVGLVVVAAQNLLHNQVDHVVAVGDGLSFELDDLADEARLGLVLDAEQELDLVMQLVQLVHHLLVGVVALSCRLSIKEEV